MVSNRLIPKRESIIFVLVGYAEALRVVGTYNPMAATRMVSTD